MFFVFIVLLLIVPVFTQNYCKRSIEVQTTQPGECYSSTTYDVQNCCVECLQINIINQSSVLKCVSLYGLGYTSCTSQSEAAADNLAGGGTCTCLCNPGSDKSQVNNGSFNHISLLIFSLLIQMIYLMM